MTQYGVAELRGATDADVIAALLNVADSRFQEAPRETAVEAELAVALEALSARQGSIRDLLGLAWRGLRAVRDPRLGLAFERMALNHPRGVKQRFFQALLAAALKAHVHDSGRPLSGNA